MAKQTAIGFPRWNSGTPEKFWHQIVRPRVARRAFQVDFLFAWIRPSGTNRVFRIDCLPLCGMRRSSILSIGRYSSTLQAAFRFRLCEQVVAKRTRGGFTFDYGETSIRSPHLGRPRSPNLGQTRVDPQGADRPGSCSSQRTRRPARMILRG